MGFQQKAAITRREVRAKGKVVKGEEAEGIYARLHEHIEPYQQYNSPRCSKTAMEAF
jgi:hypothetical protein